MRISSLLAFVCIALVSCTNAPQDTVHSVAELSERGQALFFLTDSCVDCHGADGAGGLLAPALDANVTPRAIDYQLRTNPEMAELADMLDATPDDLLALSVFIRELTGGEEGAIDVAALQAQAPEPEPVDVPAEATAAPTASGGERDAMIRAIEDFSVVVDTWERRARPGSLLRTYDVTVTAEFDPGEPRFTPEPGKTYFYENVGTRGTRNLATGETFTPEGMKVVVGDAETLEVIASYEIPAELRSSVHSTALSPDGRYVYISGAAPSGDLEPPGAGPGLSRAAASILKVDALTLQPVRQLAVGGRMHHAQVFRDRYMLIDSFAQDEDGLTAYLFDPETDTIIGGFHESDLGGNAYTAWTDNEFIYVLVEPNGYGMQAARRYLRGELTMVPSSWVARIDPDTWEVLQEYPHPGHRADWICFDHDSSHMYVPSTGNNTVTRINIETGEIAWARPTGPGPYGCSVNADSSEVWIADKGEATGLVGGRTVTVYETATGDSLDVLFSAYRVDHILLSPGGNEFWATSNYEGAIYVFDALTRERKGIIDIPGGGDLHGLVWVHYDESGTARVVRDQGGFHHGTDPRAAL